MPQRKQVLATNEVYHVVNRGVASVPIFNNTKDYKRFVDLIHFYSHANVNLNFSSFIDLNADARTEYLIRLEKESKKTIETLAYCLMPNHFHFLVKQLEDDGIKTTFSKVQNAYAKYINSKNSRNGPLFQSRFKALRVETDELLLHISRYIHLNPLTAFLTEPETLSKYPWSSYGDFVGIKKSADIEINTNFILKIAGGESNYKKFVTDQADYQRKLGAIKHLLLE